MPPRRRVLQPVSVANTIADIVSGTMQMLDSGEIRRGYQGQRRPQSQRTQLRHRPAASLRAQRNAPAVVVRAHSSTPRRAVAHSTVQRAMSHAMLVPLIALESLLQSTLQQQDPLGLDGMISPFFESLVSSPLSDRTAGRRRVRSLVPEQNLRAMRVANPPAQRAAIAALPSHKVTSAEVAAASESRKTCAVCMEEFRAGEQMRTLPCFHDFHKRCVDRWLRQQGVCPICKHRVDGQPSSLVRPDHQDSTGTGTRSALAPARSTPTAAAVAASSRRRARVASASSTGRGRGRPRLH